MKTLKFEVTDGVYATLARQARNAGCGKKPETIAAEVIEDHARGTHDLHRRFAEAAREVDRRRHE